MESHREQNLGRGTALSNNHEQAGGVSCLAPLQPAVHGASGEDGVSTRATGVRAPARGCIDLIAFGLFVES